MQPTSSLPCLRACGSSVWRPQRKLQRFYHEMRLPRNASPSRTPPPAGSETPCTLTSDRMTAFTTSGCSSICSSASSSRELVPGPSTSASGRVSCPSPSSMATQTRANCRRCCAQNRRSERSSSNSKLACCLESTDETDCLRSHMSSAASSLAASSEREAADSHSVTLARGHPAAGHSK